MSGIAMNGTTGNRPERRWMVFATLAAVALLATTFRVHTQASFVAGSGPTGSAAYRQVIAFATCLRGHGVPDIPNPPPGSNAALSVPVPKSGPTARAVDACKRLAPSGRDNLSVSITP